jgi:8-oxo-dGTP diphosphatase
VTECGVTANIPVLGTGDSGFESRHSDQFMKKSILNRPKAAVVAFVRKDKKILLGKRVFAHGTGTWGLPGGHLEYGETVEECARREVLEEANVKIKNIVPISYTEDFFPKEKCHYITIFVVCDFYSGQVKVNEPDKCEEWKWFDWNGLPKPLFVTLRNVLKQKFHPFEI